MMTLTALLQSTVEATERGMDPMLSDADMRLMVRLLQDEAARMMAGQADPQATRVYLAHMEDAAGYLDEAIYERQMDSEAQERAHLLAVRRNPCGLGRYL